MKGATSLLVLFLCLACSKSKGAPGEGEAAAKQPAEKAAEQGKKEGSEDPKGPLAHLQGHWGFVWTQAAPKCTEMTPELLAKLAGEGGTCNEKAPGESFGVDRGKWHLCIAGKDETMVFATREICDEMRETHEANAP